MPATTAAIARMPLFRECTPDELRLIGRLAEEIRVGDGEVVVREGRAGYEFFAIASGRAQVDRRGRTVAMLGPGDHFGELAILGRTHRDATVLSSGPLELLVLDERAFLGLLAELPSFCRRVLEAMAQRLRRQDLGAAATDTSGHGVDERRPVMHENDCRIGSGGTPTPAAEGRP